MKNLLEPNNKYVIPVQESVPEDRVSPFIIHSNTKYKRVRSRDCSGLELQRLIVNGDIKQYHDAIIKMLGRYGFLNSYLIRTHLYHMSGGAYEFDYAHMRRILKELVKRGFLIYYEFMHQCDGIEHGSPFYYTLSSGGIKYLRHQGIISVHPVTLKPFSIANVMNVLAVNQFHTTFIQQYSRNIKVRMDDYYGYSYDVMGVPAVYNIRFQENLNIRLFVISVRNYGSWSKEYLNVLRKIQNKTQCEEDVIILTICESEYHAMECARKRNCEKQLKDLDVFYITDTSILSNDKIFDRLIDVRPENNYNNRSTFRLEI